MARQGGGSYYAATTIREACGRFLAHPDRDPGGQQRVSLGLAAGQRQYAGDVPEPGVRRYVPARCGRQPDMAGQRQAVPAQIRSIARKRYASPTPMDTMPSTGLRDLCPFWRVATGRPRRPSGPTGCRARPPRRAIEGRPRSVQGRRSAASARGEPDDAGQVATCTPAQ